MIMPWKPKSICSYPGCNELTHDRYCSKHKREVNKVRNEMNSKIYNNRWRKASKAYLKDNPLCVHCKKEDRLTPATEVDHIIPHGGDMKLFWDKSNWQSLCKKCHSKKTALEDGGFGNTPKSFRG
jgi:5-methylcytosine-specific restriction protein A